MPNGVICGGAVDGSNQAGEIVTCQAITARPAGAGPSALADTGANASNIAASAARSARRPSNSPDAIMKRPPHVLVLVFIVLSAWRQDVARRRQGQARAPCRPVLPRGGGRAGTRSGLRIPASPQTSIETKRIWPESRLLLDLHVLVRRKRAHPDIGDGMLGDARADADQRAQIHDRREHHPVDRQLLDLVQQRRALVAVTLARLLLVKFVDVGIAATGKRALGLDERLDPAGGIARTA